MPQFSPSVVKTATVPVVAKPSGMSCEAELFLGPDELTKVATSGRKAFTSTGGAQNVSLPVTMPVARGSYKVYIDVFTGTIRFLAYKATEDVTIGFPELLSGNILIQKCDGKPFSLVEGNVATLSEPTVKSALYPMSAGGISLIWKNLSLPPYRPDNYTQIHFRFQYKLPGAVPPYDDAPQYYTIMDLPTSVGGVYTTPFYHWYGGYWKPGVYDGVFKWGLCFFDQAFASMPNIFTIKNMVKCTGTGQYTQT